MDATDMTLAAIEALVEADAEIDSDDSDAAEAPLLLPASMPFALLPVLLLLLLPLLLLLGRPRRRRCCC